MNKNHYLYVGLGVIITAASLAFGFALHKRHHCHHHGHHGYHAKAQQGESGKSFAPMSEKKLKRIARKLDLSEAQRDALFAVAESKRETMREIAQQKRATRDALLELDPTAANYRQRATQLAADAADLARRRTLLFADIKSELADTLTEAQAQKVMRMLTGRGHHKYRRNH